MSTALLDGPRVPPASGGPARNLVILCHGYGANGDDLIGLASAWRSVLPDTAFVSPHAPEAMTMVPGGYQWFAIDRLDPRSTAQGVLGAAPVLDAFIDSELKRAGLTERQLALVGFSQGTMMALHVGLRRTIAPAAILGYSGMLTSPDRLESEVRVKPPIFLIHGDADPLVPVQALHAAVEHLAEAGLAVQWHVSPNIPHTIGSDGLELGGRFLAESFAAAAAGSDQG